MGYCFQGDRVMPITVSNNSRCATIFVLVALLFDRYNKEKAAKYASTYVVC